MLFSLSRIDCHKLAHASQEFLDAYSISGQSGKECYFVLLSLAAARARAWAFRLRKLARNCLARSGFTGFLGFFDSCGMGVNLSFAPFVAQAPGLGQRRRFCP